MLELIQNTTPLFFPGMRLLKVIKNGMKITNSTNPLIAAKNITLTVVDCCAPPPVRLAAHCIAATAAVGASVVSPNPITLGSAFHFISELYDQC